MTTYELPPEADGLSVEEATAAFNTLTRAMVCDDQHPLASTANPNHEIFNRRYSALGDVAARAKIDAANTKEQDFISQIERGEIGPQKQLRAEAQAEMNALVEKGFERAEIAPDIQPWQVAGLKMQRQLAENDLDGVGSILTQELNALRADSKTMSLFAQFRDGDIDPTLRSTIAEQLIHWVYQTRQHQAKEYTRRAN